MTLSFDIASLREAYAAGTSTPEDVAAEALRRIEGCDDPAVWITRIPEQAVRRRARELTGLKNRAHLPLFGIPFAIKDNIDCAGLPTTAGCPAFSYMPARDAPIVAKLIGAGAILLGKTNLDQFATGLVGTRSPYGTPRCVFDHNYISGGSSSGSAVAVAARLVSFALGTDTAGSGRVPAAFNNIVGIKPTCGLASTLGVVPACRTLDCVSIFAGTVSDGADALRVVAGFEPDDPFSRESPSRSLPNTQFRFGVLAERDREFQGNAAYASLYDAAIERMEKLGGQPIEVDFASFRDAGRLLYDGPWIAERTAAIAGFIARHADEMNPTVRQIIAGGASISAVSAFEGIYRLGACRRAAEREWTRMDIMLLPTAPTHFTVDDVAADPIELNKQLGTYTNFVNLLDTCAVSVPAGFTKGGLPFGVTLIGPSFSDAALGVIADRLHRSAPCGIGATRDAALPAPREIEARAHNRLNLLVIGAHLSGMALNHELAGLGAKLVGNVRTAHNYRLFVLPNTTPPKPGLIRDPAFAGPGIEGELWSLEPSAFGAFVARIPAPLGIGKVTLEDGSIESGFLCEAYGVAGAREISSLGSWRRFVEGAK